LFMKKLFITFNLLFFIFYSYAPMIGDATRGGTGLEAFIILCCWPFACMSATSEVLAENINELKYNKANLQKDQNLNPINLSKSKEIELITIKTKKQFLLNN
jgi:hypothetical protein